METLKFDIEFQRAYIVDIMRKQAAYCDAK